MLLDQTSSTWRLRRTAPACQRTKQVDADRRLLQAMTVPPRFLMSPKPARSRMMKVLAADFLQSAAGATRRVSNSIKIAHGEHAQRGVVEPPTRVGRRAHSLPRTPG